ncbi:MAG: hypothetical protein QOG21_1763 [Actinomycetota bacterium]|jgi:hypothetical protein|nr:hypothetical protein [Actinomycetota bacterium]
MRRGFLGFAATAFALLTAGAGLATTPARARAAITCGVERWAVKTLSDPAASQVDFNPRHVGVQHLRLLPKPDVGPSSPRLRPYEFRTYRVHVRIKAAALEDDHDFHLVVAQPHHPKRTMILEFPSVHCKGAASSIKKNAMRHARRHLLAACGPIGTSFVHLHGRAVVRGVAFFDIDHGQTGVAPNAIELHPVLRFTARSRCTR